MSRRSANLVRSLPAVSARAHAHLVANALSQVASLLRRRPEAAEDLLAYVAGVVRTHVAPPRPLVPFDDELSAVMTLLGVERARLGGRLRVEVARDPAAADVPVPPGMLHALVENAVTHGIARRPDGGCVRVRAWVRCGRLHVAVADDGPGMPRASAVRRASGFGLIGVRYRLAALWGAEARLRLLTWPGRGVVAVVSLPAP